MWFCRWNGNLALLNHSNSLAQWSSLLCLSPASRNWIPSLDPQGRCTVVCKAQSLSEMRWFVQTSWFQTNFVVVYLWPYEVSTPFHCSLQLNLPSIFIHLQKIPSNYHKKSQITTSQQPLLVVDLCKKHPLFPKFHYAGTTWKMAEPIGGLWWSPPTLGKYVMC